MTLEPSRQPDPEHVSESVRQQLRDGESLFLSLVHSIPACFLRKDRDGRIVFVNEQFAALFGKRAEDIVGKTVGDLYSRPFAEAAREEDERVMRTGQVLEDVFEDTVQGELKYFASRKGPVRGEDGQVIGIQTIFWDITKQRVAEQALLAEREELREAKKAAEKANRAKSDFLANISHEIRTPMNAIIGMTELLLGSELSSTQREYLKMVQDSGEALMMLINDILDFSKIEAGKLELDVSGFDLRDAVGDTVKGLGFRAHTKGLELALRIDDAVPTRVKGDPGRIRQVLVNLVGNAIKFTESGEVVVQVTAHHDPPRDCRVRFEVRDTGIGIAEEHRARIFEEFEQADTSTTRRFGGTGLGLAICSRLVHLMHGCIDVQSEPGRGSRFTFELPLAIDDDPEPSRRPAAPDIEHTRVLIVDDNATNLRILSDGLDNWGMQTVACRSADDALQAFERAIQQQSPLHMMISDVNMPTKDGLMLAKEVVDRAWLKPASIIMLTSAARPEDATRLQELGIHRHLLKPVKPSEIYDAVISSLDETSTASPLPLPARKPRPVRDLSTSLKILLAEDNIVNQKLAVALLQKLGHQVAVANNGLNALARIEEQAFDLVLMDVQMPEMDGLEATRELRRRERKSGKRVKVLAMTAHAMKGDRERCLQAGMDDYLCKPIRFREIRSKLKEMFPQPSSPPHPEHAVSSADVEEIDWQKALESVAGDQQLFREVIAICQQETPTLMNDVLQALQRRDAEAVKRSTHTLKGSLLFLNPAKLIAAAEQVEELATDEDWPQLIPAIDHLKNRIDAVESQLRRMPSDT